MNMTKMAMVLVLGSFAAHAFAENAPAQDTSVQTYSYSTNLDIAHVISITEPTNECAPVPVRMTYEDSHGERHVLQYQVMGTGCSS